MKVKLKFGESATLLLGGVVQQQTKNSCWAACARHVYNWYAGRQEYASDSALAQAVNKNVGQMADMDTILTKLGLLAGYDDQPFPKFTEISDEIAAFRPLIACITTSQSDVQNKKTDSGHYVVITGRNVIQAKGFITVYDPAKGSTNEIQYDDKIYFGYENPVCYWHMTYYTSKP